jgi:hypothetical protein
MSRFNISCASPGFCSLCYDEIAEFEGFYDFGNIKRPKVKFLKPNFRQAMVKLSDGSYMNVSLCDKCVNFLPERTEELFQSEIRGWQTEVDAMKGHVENHELLEAYIVRQKDVSIIDREDVKWTDSEKLNIAKRGK